MKRKIIFIVFLLLTLAALVSSFAFASKEYNIKAAMLVRIADNIVWPAGSQMKDKTKTFDIAVFGKNPFSPPLESVYAENKIKDKKVKIHYISSAEEIDQCGCHLLFITKSNKKILNEIISFTKHKPVLIISDNKGYTEKGIHVNILIVENKLKFEINHKSIREAGLEINYHLLRLAKKVIK